MCVFVFMFPSNVSISNAHLLTHTYSHGSFDIFVCVWQAHTRHRMLIVNKENLKT